MAKRHLLLLLIFLGALTGTAAWMAAQGDESEMTTFRVTVVMVQMDVAVTDSKGNYLSGLSPLDFTIYEDGIQQKLATFGEANKAPRSLEDYKPGEGNPNLVASFTGKTRKPGQGGSAQGSPSGESSDGDDSPVAGASVFILFDTSNYMYRDFVFAQDAIAQFVKSLDRADRVAFYSYSRNLSRASLITPDRSAVLRRIRTDVAGDDAALYDALLLTLRDAAQFTGRRVVVVFSNGPDNASMVAPEDVRELAQSEGIPIYMISTQGARLDPLSTAVFERISATTGGKAYFARRWTDQQKAFASVRDDLGHLYTLSYYPQPNPNNGWRAITVKLVGENLKKYQVRTRSGYRPLPKTDATTARMTPAVDAEPASR